MTLGRSASGAILARYVRLMETPAVELTEPLSQILTLAKGGSVLPGMLLAAATLLITLSVLSMLRKKLARRASAPTPTQKRRAKQAQDLQSLDPSRRSLEELMVQAEELVRRLAAHLDNKAARIELLLKDADLQLSRPDPQQPGQSHSTHESSPAPVILHRSAADAVSLDVYRLADDGLPPIEIASQLSEGVGKVELILALRSN